VERELLTEARWLLGEGLPRTVPRALDADCRFIPLSLDADADVAAILFARRLPAGPRAGHPGVQILTLQRLGGQWVALGGGQGALHDYPLRDRRPAAGQGGYLSQHGSGFVVKRNPDSRLPRRSRRVYQARFRAAAEVDKIKAGNRLLTVPFHGYTVIVWQGRRPPAVTAIAADGSQLASLNPDLDRFRLRTALRRRLRRPVPRRQLAPGVLQYGPGLRSRPK
jgi:hypothetical protein